MPLSKMLLIASLGFRLMYPFKLFAKPLPEAEQAALIDSFKARLSALPGLTTLYLIGSASRMKMTDASDLDFVAVFDSDVARDYAKKDFYNYPRPADWPCDVLWYSIDEFESRSKIGGICLVAVQDGLKLFPRN